MPAMDDLIDVSVALGKGVYSVGEDIVLGFERTTEGLGFGQSGRITAIDYENRAMVSLLKKSIEYGASGQLSPIFRTIRYILEHYYSYFPKDALAYLLKQAGVGAAYTTGRMLMGRQLALVVSLRIASAIAMSAAYKMLARRIGVSAGASASGIGFLIGSLMIQGLMQRSSNASFRLKSKNQKLHKLLRQNGNLQLLYFILEKPLKKYLDAIELAEHDLTAFQKKIAEKYLLQ